MMTDTTRSGVPAGLINATDHAFSLFQRAAWDGRAAVQGSRRWRNRVLQAALAWVQENPQPRRDEYGTLLIGIPWHDVAVLLESGVTAAVGQDLHDRMAQAFEVAAGPVTSAGVYPGECGQAGYGYPIDTLGVPYPGNTAVRRVVISRCAQHVPSTARAPLSGGQTSPCTWTAPRRIQRRRTPGWRSPMFAQIVTRPTVWGSPFIIGAPWCPDAETAVTLHRTWLELGALPLGFEIDPKRYPKGITSMTQWRDIVLADAPTMLSGRVLVCWCPEDQPWCHADTLITVANRGIPGYMTGGHS
jgi:hypothetical protein